MRTVTDECPNQEIRVGARRLWSTGPTPTLHGGRRTYLAIVAPCRAERRVVTRFRAVQWVPQAAPQAGPWL